MSLRDWSSDVCSSDLVAGTHEEQVDALDRGNPGHVRDGGGALDLDAEDHLLVRADEVEIGRASCRERGWTSVVGRFAKTHALTDSIRSRSDSARHRRA